MVKKRDSNSWKRCTGGICIWWCRVNMGEERGKTFVKRMETLFQSIVMNGQK